MHVSPEGQNMNICSTILALSFQILFLFPFRFSVMMKGLKTAVIPKVEPLEKRISKPLPLPPRSVTIDNAARMHISKLLNNWLFDLHIPLKPWTDVLFNIVISILEKSVNATDRDHNKIWIQTLSNNTPVESRFLLNVYHGKPVNEGIPSKKHPESTKKN